MSGSAAAPSPALARVLGALALPAIACAPAAAKAETTLPEVVVSASRVAVPIESVGSAVTVITEQDLETRQTVTVADVLREVPGVSVGRSGGLGSLTQVRIRGAESNQTLVLIDGVEANDPAFGSEFDFAHLLAADVERIEVLRGNQSALWGSDAIGGVVSVTTKRGRKGLRVNGRAEGGSFGGRAGGGTVSGGADGYDFAFSGNYARADGFNLARESIVRDRERGQGEDDGYRNTTLSGTTRLRPHEAVELLLTGRYVNALSKTDPQDFSTSGPPLFTPSPTQGFVIDGNDWTHTIQRFGRAEGKVTLFDGMWEHRLGAAITDTDNNFVQDAVPTTQSAGRKLKLDYQTSLFLATPDLAQADHTITFAVEREREDFQQRAAPSPFGNSNQDQTQINRGLVGEYRVSLWDRLFLSGSGRRDFNDVFADATTWRTTAAYLHEETQTRLHGSFGTGVKNPTFTELFGFFPNMFVPNPNLRPETSRGWDVGIEQSFYDGRVVVDVTYFRQRLEDEIVTQFPPPTFIGTPVNLGGISKRRGFEVSARARITDDLDAGMNYTFLRSTFPDQTLAPKIRLEARRPRHSGGVNATWRFDEDRGRVHLGVQYNGPTEDDEFNGNTARNRVELKGYVLVNMAVTYKLTEHVELFGRIDNLLDQDYEEVYSFSTPGIAGFGGVRVSLEALAALPELWR